MRQYCSGDADVGDWSLVRQTVVSNMTSRKIWVTRTTHPFLKQGGGTWGHDLCDDFQGKEAELSSTCCCWLTWLWYGSLCQSQNGYGAEDSMRG